MPRKKQQTASRAKLAGTGEIDPARLDYWTFVNQAVHRTSERLPEISAEPMLLLMTLRRATNLIFYDVHVALTRQSVIMSAAAMTTLLVLSVCGPLEIRQVVHLSGQSRAAVSALTAGLVRQGLVRRETSNGDKRVVRIALTPKGSRLFDAACSVFNRQEQLWAESLTRAERATFVSLLNKMVMARWHDERMHRRS